MTEKIIYTLDWFSNNIQRWSKILKKYKNKETHVLIDGIYEGRAVIWLFDNILTHPKCTVTCVQNFTGNKVNLKTWAPLKPAQSTLSIFKKNLEIKNLTDKVHIYDGEPVDMLRNNDLIKQNYDIIYIDANRHSKHVLEDSVLAYPMLKPGGYLIFDDYTSNREHDNACPKQAIDAFMDIYASEIKVKELNWQAVLEKRIKPLKVKNCASEYYENDKSNI